MNKTKKKSSIPKGKKIKVNLCGTPCPETHTRLRVLSLYPTTEDPDSMFSNYQTVNGRRPKSTHSFLPTNTAAAGGAPVDYPMSVSA